ncbi:MAG: PAS domain S-box protein [Bacteroidetes bacterium]|nr:PAS domain S-box protein [Bacteroidota bacterium]
MKATKKDENTDSSNLRRKAEALVKSKVSKHGGRLDEAGVHKLLHELEVNQIELELQNEELLVARSIAEDEAEKYAELYDYAPSGYLVLSPSGEILKLNHACARMIGKESSRLTGSTFAFFVSDDTRHLFNDFFQSIFTDMSGATCEVTLEVEDRQPISVHMDGRLSGSGGQCLATMVDITMRKQAEELLRQSEERYARAFQTAPYAVTITRMADGKFIEVNRAFTAITGYTKEEAMNDSSVGLKLWADISDRDKVIAELKAGRDVSGMENLFRKKDGQILTGLVSSQVIQLNNEPFILSSINDITERKKGEQSLWETNAYLENLINYANAPIIVWNPQLCITRFNHAFEFLTGRTEAEVRGKSLKILFPPGFVEHSMALIRHTSTGQRWESVEIRILHRDNSVRIVLWNSATLFAPDGVTPIATIAQGQDITQRKQTEDVLHKSEALYRSILNASPDDITIADLEGNILFTSPKALTMFGYENSEQLFNRNILEFLIPDDYRAAQTEIARMHQGLSSGLGEFHGVKSDGSIFDVEVNTEFIRNAEGKPTSMLFIIRDISHRKQVEEELEKAREKTEESEKRFKEIIQFQAEGIGFTDNNEIFEFANPAAEKIFETGDGELVGTSLFDFLTPGETEKIRQQTQFRKGGLTGAYEIQIVTKKGTEKFLNVSTSPKFDEHRNYLGAYGVFRDITETKQARLQLEKSEERFRQVVEQSHEVVWEVDAAGLYTYVSPLALPVYGYTPDQMVGKLHFYELHPEYQREQFKAAALEMFSRKERFCDFVNLILKPDGTRIFVSTNGIPILDEHGGLLGYLGADSDITERKYAAEQLHELNAELELRVDERTSQLEAANKELDAFSYSISHDLRAPLRHINGFIGLLKELKTGNSPEELQYMDIISKGSSEMSLLIDALLSFSKLNRAELRKTNINNASLVKQVISFFEPETRDRAVSFTIGTVHDSRGDEQLIRQVWVNLISNAIKYTGKKPEAFIEIGSTKQDGKITYFVKDNGAGFDMQFAGRLFGVFKRLHRPGDFEGIGVGLANVNSIVTRHGGYCGATGEVEKGSTFFFTLPA